MNPNPLVCFNIPEAHEHMYPQVDPRGAHLPRTSGLWAIEA